MFMMDEFSFGCEKYCRLLNKYNIIQWTIFFTFKVRIPNLLITYSNFGFWVITVENQFKLFFLFVIFFLGLYTYKGLCNIIFKKSRLFFKVVGEMGRIHVPLVASWKLKASILSNCFGKILKIFSDTYFHIHILS